MSPAARVLARARSAGIRLREAGGLLTFRAPARRMTAELRADLSGHRDEVLALLRRESSRPDSGWPSLPPGWTTGPIEACLTCERGTAARDPNGVPMHPTCT